MSCCNRSDEEVEEEEEEDDIRDCPTPTTPTTTESEDGTTLDTVWNDDDDDDDDTIILGWVKRIVVALRLRFIIVRLLRLLVTKARFILYIGNWNDDVLYMELGWDVVYCCLCGSCWWLVGYRV